MVQERGDELDEVQVDDDLNLDFITVRQIGHSPERICDQLVVAAL